MLTPSDIEQKKFRTSLRGYDFDEVDDLLDEVVATIRTLEEQLSAAGSGGAGDPSLDTGDEGAVGRALIAAQATADRLVAEAKAEAAKILEEAREEADSWISERDRTRAAVVREVDELTGHIAGVRAQLSVLAAAIADRLDEMDRALSGPDLSDGGDVDDDVEPGELEDEEPDSPFQLSGEYAGEDFREEGGPIGDEDDRQLD